MPKLISFTKRVNKKITLLQAMLVFMISGLITILLVAILVKYNYYVLIFFLIPIVLVWICCMCISVYKTIDERYICMQNYSLRVIKRILSPSFTKISFAKNSKSFMTKNIFSDPNLSFWSKLDENDIITLIVKDNNGIVVYEEKTTDYVRFLENFYIYDFFR